MTTVTLRANLPRLNPGQARPVTPPVGNYQEEYMTNLGQGLRRVRVRSLLLIAVLATAVLLPASPAAAGNNQACENRTNNTYRKVLECVTLEGVREHQAAFQAIANANGGNRAAGLPGYTGSVEYVVDRLEAAGWDVTLDEFPFTFLATPTLTQLTPVNATYPTGAFTGSGTGTVTGNVIPVDINLVPPRDRDERVRGGRLRRLNFGGPADIALIQRGTCTLRRQGDERSGCRRGGRDHLQPGRTPRCARA